MRIIYSPEKAQEVLLNLALLMSKTTTHKEQLRLRLIKIWYVEWFKNPQNENLYLMWSAEWNGLLNLNNFNFPLPENTVPRKSKTLSHSPCLKINGEIYPLSKIKIFPIEKQFLNKSLIVQKSQFFSSFIPQKNDEPLLIVSVKDKGDLLVPRSHVKIGRAA